jgi:hypothetical protein
VRLRITGSRPKTASLRHTHTPPPASTPLSHPTTHPLSHLPTNHHTPSQPAYNGRDFRTWSRAQGGVAHCLVLCMLLGMLSCVCLSLCMCVLDRCMCLFVYDGGVFQCLYVYLDTIPPPSLYLSQFKALCSRYLDMINPHRPGWG